MNIGIVGQKTFLSGVPEVGAVIDTGLFGGGTAEDFWFPGIEVGVEVDDGDGTVFAVDAAE